MRADIQLSRLARPTTREQNCCGPVHIGALARAELADPRPHGLSRHPMMCATGAVARPHGRSAASLGRLLGDVEEARQPSAPGQFSTGRKHALPTLEPFFPFRMLEDCGVTKSGSVPAAANLGDRACSIL